MLGPRWLCHPKVPPGVRRFSTTLTSESPFVLRSSFQSPVLMLTLTGPRLPAANGVEVSPPMGAPSVTLAKAATATNASTIEMTIRLDMGLAPRRDGGGSRSALRPTYEGVDRAPTVPACLRRGCWH